MKHTGERPELPENIKTEDSYLLYLRSLFAYEYVIKSIPPGSKVLDVGCGNGHGTKVLLETTNAIGIDKDEEAINRCKNNIGPNFFTWEYADIADVSFDYIVAFQIIEHIDDDVGFIKDLNRILKPGGMLFLATPNRKYRLGPNQKPWNCFHVREYTASEIEVLVRKISNDVTIVGVGANPDIFNRELRRLRWIKYLPLRVIHRFMPKRECSEDFKNEHSTSDFCVCAPDSGLDLLVVAKKEVVDSFKK